MSYLAGNPLISASRQAWDGAATTQGQTVIPIPGGFTPGMCDVFVGGACLSGTGANKDFDDSSGSQIVLSQGMSLGVQYRVVVYAPGATVTNSTPNKASIVWITPAAGTNFIPFVHTVGCAWPMQRGVFLQPEDYTEDGTGFYLTSITCDGVEKFGVQNITPMTIGNVLSVNNPVIASGPMTFADGTIQYGAGYSSLRNMVINGACMRATRGSLVLTNSVAGYGAVDLFSGYNNQGTATGQFNMISSTLAIGGLNYPSVCQRVVAAPSFATNGFWSGIQHIVEGLQCYQANGKPTALSFLFAASNNGVYGYVVRDGGLNNSFAGTFNYTGNGNAQYVTVSVPANAAAVFPVTSANGVVINIGGLGVGNSVAGANGWQAGNFNVAPGVYNWGANVNGYIMATNIQFEQAVNATPFEARHYSIEELLCSRYLWSSYYSGWTPGSPNVNTAVTCFTTPATNNWSNVGQGVCPARMRVVPAGTVYSPKTGASGMAYRNNAGVDAAANVTTSPYYWTINMAGTGQPNEGIQAHILLSAEL